MNNFAYAIAVPKHAKNFLKFYFTEFEIYKVNVLDDERPGDIVEVLDEFGNPITSSVIEKRKENIRQEWVFRTEMYYQEVTPNVFIGPGNNGYPAFFRTFEEAVLSKKIYLNKLKEAAEKHVEQLNAIIAKKLPHNFTEEIQNALNGE